MVTTSNGVGALALQQASGFKLFWNNKVCTLLKKFVHTCYLE